jgi:hypothetical protein
MPAIVRAISVKCPQCAASLDVTETARTAQCAYCGTTSRIQARTRFLERPIAPLVLAPEEARLPVARQPHSGRWIASLVLVPVILGAIAIPAFLAVQGKLSGKRLWMSQGTIAVDVTGDGVADAVGRVQPIGGETMRLAAIDGAGGDLLWERELGSAKEGNEGWVTLAGDTVLFAGSRGAVRAFASRDGSPRWDTPVGEQIDAACAGGEGAILLRTKDERWHRLDLASGQRSDGAAPEACEALPNDRGKWQHPEAYGYYPGFRGRYDWSDDVPTPRQLEGMKVDESADLGDERWIALGHKQPGTRVPMIARFRVEGYDPGAATWKSMNSRDKEAIAFPVLWQHTVPAGDPLAAEEGDPELIAVAGDRVLVAYEMDDGPPRVTVFALEGGERLFDVALEEQRIHNLVSLSAAGDRIFINNANRLIALEAATGKRVFSIGW